MFIFALNDELIEVFKSLVNGLRVINYIFMRLPDPFQGAAPGFIVIEKAVDLLVIPE